MQDPAHDVLGAIEVSPPEPVGDNGYRTVSAAVALIVPGRQSTADRGLHAKGLEKRPADPQAVDDYCVSPPEPRSKRVNDHAAESSKSCWRL